MHIVSWNKNLPDLCPCSLAIENMFLFVVDQGIITQFDGLKKRSYNAVGFLLGYSSSLSIFPRVYNIYDAYVFWISMIL